MDSLFSSVLCKRMYMDMYVCMLFVCMYVLESSEKCLLCRHGRKPATTTRFSQISSSRDSVSDEHIHTYMHASESVFHVNL
jgi:hypothetical protein